MRSIGYSNSREPTKAVFAMTDPLEKSARRKARVENLVLRDVDICEVLQLSQDGRPGARLLEFKCRRIGA